MHRFKVIGGLRGGEREKEIYFHIVDAGSSGSRCLMSSGADTSPHLELGMYLEVPCPAGLWTK